MVVDIYHKLADSHNLIYVMFSHYVIILPRFYKLLDWCSASIGLSVMIYKL